MTTPPDFPDRPDHPDFWLLSQVILDLDAQADSGQSAGDIIGRYVDPASVIYMARQRALKAILRGEPSRKNLLTATWIDGFLAGASLPGALVANQDVNEEVP